MPKRQPQATVLFNNTSLCYEYLHAHWTLNTLNYSFYMRFCVVVAAFAALPLFQLCFLLLVLLLFINIDAVANTNSNAIYPKWIKWFYIYERSTYQSALSAFHLNAQTLNMFEWKQIFQLRSENIGKTCRKKQLSKEQKKQHWIEQYWIKCMCYIIEVIEFNIALLSNWK